MHLCYTMVLQHLCRLLLGVEERQVLLVALGLGLWVSAEMALWLLPSVLSAPQLLQLPCCGEGSGTEPRACAHKQRGRHHDVPWQPRFPVSGVTCPCISHGKHHRIATLPVSPSHAVGPGWREPCWILISAVYFLMTS